MKGAKRIGIEFDHVNLDFRKQLAGCLPGRGVRRRRRTLDADAHDQVAEEIKHITKMTRIADIGGAAVRRGDRGGRARA